ncbi:MAG: PIN domain-containing protein [Candidatus Anammoxibacter sp.]
MDKLIFVDTNVFLRFFVRDVESSYLKARELFEKAENKKVKLVTNDLVVAEIVWVLESYYNFSRGEIKEVIDAILETKNMKVANHVRIKETVRHYSSSNIDFIDAYNIAYVKRNDIKKIATFDVKHFKNVEDLFLIW